MMGMSFKSAWLSCFNIGHVSRTKKLTHQSKCCFTSALPHATPPLPYCTKKSFTLTGNTGKLILGNVVYPSQADTVQSHHKLSVWKGRRGKGRRNSQGSPFHLHLLLLTSLARLWHHLTVSGQLCIDLADIFALQ